MDFYLVRHGEAVSETIDPQRPLTRLGRQDVERLARCAMTRNIRPAAILHSGILRARQTAETMAEVLSPPAGIQAIAGLLPGDDTMVARGEIEAAERSLMIVGHLPHLSRLVALLTHRDAQSESMVWTPAMMVCCSCDGGAWQTSWIIKPESD